MTVNARCQRAQLRKYSTDDEQLGSTKKQRHLHEGCQLFFSSRCNRNTWLGQPVGTERRHARQPCCALGVNTKVLDLRYRLPCRWQAQAISQRVPGHCSEYLTVPCFDNYESEFIAPRQLISTPTQPKHRGNYQRLEYPIVLAPAVPDPDLGFAAVASAAPGSSAQRRSPDHIRRTLDQPHQLTAPPPRSRGTAGGFTNNSSLDLSTVISLGSAQEVLESLTWGVGVPAQQNEVSPTLVPVPCWS